MGLSDPLLLWGVLGLTLLTLLFTGPGLWSNRSGFPFIEAPVKWLRLQWTKLMAERRGPPDAR